MRRESKRLARVKMVCVRSHRGLFWSVSCRRNICRPPDPIRAGIFARARCAPRGRSIRTRSVPLRPTRGSQTLHMTTPPPTQHPSRTSHPTDRRWEVERLGRRARGRRLAPAAAPPLGRLPAPRPAQWLLAAARRQAVNLLLVGSRLARLRHGTDTLLDIWTISVIPFVVCRTT